MADPELKPLDVALRYASMGWHVLPLRPGTKIPLTEHGYHDAVTDAAKIRAWWTETPDAGIGIATGESGLVVLDVDPRNGGRSSFLQLERELGDDPWTTVRDRTGGGGMHFFYLAPKDAKVQTRSGAGGRSGIDLKADTGYVVAPPSRHPDGPTYAWVKGAAPWDLAPREFPKDLLKLLGLGPDSPAAKKAYQVPARVEKGHHHKEIVKMAGKLTHAGFSLEATLDTVWRQVESTFDPPPGAENGPKQEWVRKTAADVWNRYHKEAAGANGADHKEAIAMRGRGRLWYDEGGWAIEAEGSAPRTVIHAPFEVVERVDVVGADGVYVVKDLGGDFSGDANQIGQRLGRNGQIASRKDASDALSFLLRAAPNHTRAYRGFGVWAHDGKLEVAGRFAPANEVGEEVVAAIRKTMARETVAEDWDKYAEFTRFLEPFEYLATMGLAAIVPFTPVFRNAMHRVVIPSVYNFSNAHGVGKTSVALAFSTKLWGIDLEDGGALNSDFRFAVFLDSSAVLFGIDEAEQFEWTDYGGFIKKGMESLQLASRGTKEQRMTRYRSIGSFIFTSNELPEFPGALATRLLIVHFNEQRSSMPPQSRNAFDAALRALPAVGASLVRAAVGLFEGSEAKAADILAAWAAELDRLVPAWLDSRRSRMWAAVYVGLKIWEHASGGVLAAPTIEEFVDQVVVPIEKTTSRAVVDPLAQLQSWIAQYVARNQVFHGDGEGGQVSSIRGEGELFRPHAWDEPRIEGFVVTRPFLDLYNREQRLVEARIPDLPFLAELVARRLVLQVDKLTDQRGGRVYKFGYKTKRAVFVPELDAGVVQQAALTALDHVDGAGAAGAQDQAARVASILAAIRTQAASLPSEAKGVPRAQLADASVSADQLAEALDILLREGRIYAPAPDAYLPV